MNDKKISNDVAIGIILLVIVLIGGAFYLKNKRDQSALNILETQKTTVPQEITPQNIGKSESINYPTIKSQSGVSVEDIIKQALYEKYPDWKNKNYVITVTLEINQENHAIGRFTYDGGKEQYHNTGAGIWFASKNNDSWTLVSTSYVGYNGICQDFWKYNFPPDMIPDCWDNEKNIQIETKNPNRFYSYITEKDKVGIIKSFISFIKNEPYAQYYNTDNSYVLIIKNNAKYLKGMILRGGIENHSVPNFYAVKIASNWKVVFNGQDYPSCSLVEKYNIPNDIISKCYDEQNKQEKTLP